MLETMFGQNSGLGQASESLSIGPIIVVIIVIIIAVIVILILLLILVTLSIKLMINNNANEKTRITRHTLHEGAWNDAAGRRRSSPNSSCCSTHLGLQGTSRAQTR